MTSAKTPKVIPPAYDLGGVEIQVGDWIVQAFALGRCAALKYAKVIGFSEKSGALRLVGFEQDNWEYRWDPELEERVPNEYKWKRNGPYSVQFSDRTVVIPDAAIPQSLKDYIAHCLKGEIHPTMTI